jgi:amidase
MTLNQARDTPQLYANANDIKTKLSGGSMKLNEYRTLDALGMAEMVSNKQVSPRELLGCALEMISKTQDKINAVANFDAEIAEKTGQKHQAGLFAGVPFLVKELLPYPGLTTAMGSKLFAKYVPPSGSEYTNRIDESGLLTFGNTTCSEMGLLGSTETRVHGITRNPWNQAYSAAGSSGGSAAAVASGIVPMAHANDGGGSIRVPASVCGLFGFKPSAGRCVATAEGMGPFADLVSDHCISKTVRDSAAFLSITEKKGVDARFEPLGFYKGHDTKGLRIGVYTKTLMGREADDDIKQSIDKTARLCEGLGHEIEYTSPDVDGKAVSDGFFTLAGSMISQLAAMMEPLLKRKVNGDDFEPFTLSLLHWYRNLERGALDKALADLKSASAKFLAFAETYDVLLCPTLTSSPKRLGYLSPELNQELLIQRTEDYVGYTPIHNIAGVCAMSVPLYVNEAGMPLGSHFAARPGAEKTLFDLAYQLETALPWQDILPLAAKQVG